MLKIEDRDNGYRKVTGTLRSLGNTLKVGILDQDFSKPHPSGGTIGQVAQLLEYGTETAPARSVFRAWFDQNSSQIQATLASEYQKVISGKQSKEEALAAVGEFCIQGLKKYMDAGVPPPNAPSTIRKKGSDIPGIETGTLQDTINYSINGVPAKASLRSTVQKLIRRARRFAKKALHVLKRIT